MVDALIAFLLVTGAAFMLLGSLGLARFPDPLSRLHGPSKATTLGLGALLIASMAAFFAGGRQPGVHELLITLFVALTTPVSALCVARALRRRGD
jgi:multicomponent K+:H+ antiporter subunit G